MTRKRRDANHRELVQVWLDLGGGWQDTADIPGALDGIAGMNGIDVRVEIKDGSKPPSAQKLTEQEKTVFNAWPGRPPIIWRHFQDVIDTAVMLRGRL